MKCLKLERKTFILKLALPGDEPRGLNMECPRLLIAAPGPSHIPEHLRRHEGKADATRISRRFIADHVDFRFSCTGRKLLRCIVAAGVCPQRTVCR